MELHDKVRLSVYNSTDYLYSNFKLGQFLLAPEGDQIRLREFHSPSQPEGILGESLETPRRLLCDPMPRKVQVTFSDGQWSIIEKLRGTIGDTDSEIVRNVVIAYLSEKSYIKDEALNRIKRMTQNV